MIKASLLIIWSVNGRWGMPPKRRPYLLWWRLVGHEIDLSLTDPKPASSFALSLEHSLFESDPTTQTPLAHISHLTTLPQQSPEDEDKMKVLAIVTLALLALAGVHAEEDHGRHLRPSDSGDPVHKTSSNLAEMIERLERVFKHQPKPAAAMIMEVDKNDKKPTSGGG